MHDQSIREDIIDKVVGVLNSEYTPSGQDIIKFRSITGMSKSEFCRALGVSRAHLYNVEQGKNFSRHFFLASAVTALAKS